MAILGQRLRALRQRRNFTQGHVAVYAKVDRSYISQIENGYVDSVGSDILGRIAQTLGSTTDYLLGFSANPRPPEQTTSPQTELEWQLLDAFRKLSVDEQRYIIAQLDLLLDLLNQPAFRVIGGTDDEAQETGSAERADSAQTGT